MKRAVVLGTLVATGLLAITVSGQQQGAQQPPRVDEAFARKLFGAVRASEKISDNLYLIPGAGGNSAVFVRDDGVLLVDTKLGNNGQALLDEIKKVTDKPVTHIINTHMHPDHSGSNAFFPASVEIVAHENAQAGMQKMPPFQSDAGKVGLPDRAFKNHMTLFSGKDAVDLYHFGPAHTNGDTFVRFRTARVMHAGDVFATKTAPLIDKDGGGSGIAFADTIAKAVKGMSGVDRVITGHGELVKVANVLPWQDFVDFGEFNRLFVEHARASLAAGKTPEQAASEFKLPEKFKGYEMNPPGPPGAVARNFVIIYKELGK